MNPALYFFSTNQQRKSHAFTVCPFRKHELASEADDPEPKFCRLAQFILAPPLPPSKPATQQTSTFSQFLFERHGRATPIRKHCAHLK
tara:strand:- start:7845 stop:8108 length:264 start_codon:yes stop_codon:yes gene_type:complete